MQFFGDPYIIDANSPDLTKGYSAMIVSLRMSHIILVLTTALLPLAWATREGVLLMLAVQIVGQSTMATPEPQRSAREL